MTFTDLVRTATGRPDPPYPYQQRLADEGLPDLLRVPTGAGKTMAAVLPWLYRRRLHPDETVQRETPRWLIFVLPQRALVEQTKATVEGWLTNLSLTQKVGLHLLLGGASTDDREWIMHPADDAVFVGTQDMLLSRLLLRGYAQPRAAWPISFGLLNAGVQFVFDEVQLMGPGLATSLQLQGLRELLGAAAPTRSMWMSATVDAAKLRTPDFAGPTTVVELSEADRQGTLSRRLEATRLVERGPIPTDAKQYAAGVAQLVAARHAPGSRTIVILNTVERATQVYDALTAARSDADLVLLHSRFRPLDRAAQTEHACAPPGPVGTIVVATQVLEAGVDVSARILVTEVAPWSSIVQRAGRCNRAGEHQDAALVWLPVPGHGQGASAPYAEPDLTASTTALAELEGAKVTSTDLQERRVPEVEPVSAVLRQRDLRQLFDTAPDLAGNDLDVSGWIRDADMTTTAVAWRHFGAGSPAGLPASAPFPTRAELCPVPTGQLRDRLAGRLHAAVLDQVHGEWRAARREDVRPDAVLVMDAARGGYLQTRGWSPASTKPVAEIQADEPDASITEAVSDDPRTVRASRWVPLEEHLDDVRRHVRDLFDQFAEALVGLTDAQREAAELAGLYHDLGKVHPVFAEALTVAGGDGGPPDEGGPWAKSPTKGRLRYKARYFRHELVSALLLLDPSTGLMDGVAEPDLVAFLTAAHHGKVRLAVRPMPDEPAGLTVLGVSDGTTTAPFTLPDGRLVEATTLRLDRLTLGTANGVDSWQARVCALRDRADLGPFRLGFLEALVRVADWRASAAKDTGGDTQQDAHADIGSKEA